MPLSSAISRMKPEPTRMLSAAATALRKRRRRPISVSVPGRGPYTQPSRSAWRAHELPNGSLQFLPLRGKTRSPLGQNGR